MFRGVRGVDDAIRRSSVSMAGENVGDCCEEVCWGWCCCSAVMRARADWSSASEGLSISRVFIRRVFLGEGSKEGGRDVHGSDS